jgi:hypothetical protein
MPPLPTLFFFGPLALAALFACLMLVEDVYHYVLHLCGHRNQLYTASGHPRSGKWATFEHKLIEARGGKCEACGGTEDPQGHHIEDFHAHPEKELDPDNVAILCGPKGRNCHLRIGHSFDYRAINPHAREDAARQRHRIKTRVYE